jgi:hypothetical protein
MHSMRIPVNGPAGGGVGAAVGGGVGAGATVGVGVGGGAGFGVPVGIGEGAAVGVGVGRGAGVGVGAGVTVGVGVGGGAGFGVAVGIGKGAAVGVDGGYIGGSDGDGGTIAGDGGFRATGTEVGTEFSGVGVGSAIRVDGYGTVGRGPIVGTPGGLGVKARAVGSPVVVSLTGLAWPSRSPGPHAARLMDNSQSDHWRISDCFGFTSIFVSSPQRRIADPGNLGQPARVGKRLPIDWRAAGVHLFFEGIKPISFCR